MRGEVLYITLIGLRKSFKLRASCHKKSLWNLSDSVCLAIHTREEEEERFQCFSYTRNSIEKDVHHKVVFQ